MCHPYYNRHMTQRDLFNDPIDSLLFWLRSEQRAGNLYSRRELLRMPMEQRATKKCPRFSRSGIIESLALLQRDGKTRIVGSIHKKIAASDTPLPPGSVSFL